MSTGALTALITSIASIAASVTALIHALQAKKLTKAHLSVSHPVTPVASVGSVPPPAPRIM